MISQFAFDAAHQRVIQKTSNRTTHYVGALFEFVTSGSGSNEVVEQKYYIYAPTGRVAVRTVLPNYGKVETRFLHADHLGSIVAVSDEAGKVVQRFQYDPWGNRTITLAKDGSRRQVTRGFTDHEHLDDLGLIHMNGRVYDPVLGRFLSADPFIDDLGNNQNYNRFSYVENNPLASVDPSGYSKVGDVLKVAAVIIVAVVAAYFVGPIIANGLLHAVFGAGIGVINPAIAGTYGAIGAGIAGGAASGFAGSLLNGGSIGDAFKAGAISGAIGGAAGFSGAQVLNSLPDGLQGLAENTISAAATEGFVNGATAGALNSAVYGGNFGSNVAQSAFLTSTGYAGAEASQTLWFNYKAPKLLDKEIDRYSSQLTAAQTEAFKKGSRILAAANSITPAATLVGGVVGAGVGYALGRSPMSAAIGAVVGGGIGFYTSGIDVRAEISVTAERYSVLDKLIRWNTSDFHVNVRNLPVPQQGGLYGSVDVSVAPVIFGYPIENLSFGATAWTSWSGASFKTPFTSDWAYLTGQGAYDRSIPRATFLRGGR